MSEPAKYFIVEAKAMPEVFRKVAEAKRLLETGEEKTILFGLTGTGYFDMVAYERFNNGEMTDYIPTDEDLAKGLAGVPKFPGNEI